jgi:hypothetical protein
MSWWRVRLLLLALVACSAVPPPPSSGELCGSVGPLVVHADDGNGWVNCPIAMMLTRDAYAIAGPLRNEWAVLFTYGYLGFSDMDWSIPWDTGPMGTVPKGPSAVMAWGHTDNEKHAISIDEKHPAAVVHELMHARLFESEWRGTQHQEMCHHPDWLRAQAAFGVPISFCGRGQ